MNTQLLSTNTSTDRLRNIIASLVLTVLWTTLTFGQEPPSGPPDIQVSNPPNFSPPDLDSWIIPPFNSAIPESTTLGEGQKVTLRAVPTDSSLATYQWFKDEILIPGETQGTLEIDIVDSGDAGVYQAFAGEGGSRIASTEVVFLTLPLSEIEEPFGEWLSRFFTSDELENPAIGGESSDPDLDGMANLIEYAFGLDPTQKNTPPKIALKNGQLASPSLVFARAKGRDNLAFTVEGSTTLTDWVSLSTIATRIEATEQSTDSIEIEVDWDLLPEHPRFLRLKISQETTP